MHVSVLSPEQIKRIDEASLSILQRTGTLLPHPDMLSRFADAGAQVDFATQRVRIPADLVKRCLQSAGKTYTLYGRDLTRTAEFGVGKRNYNSIGGEAMWVDGIAQPRRFPRLQDVADATRLADALPQITIAGAMADPHELPVGWRCVAVMAEMIRNTTKPITFFYRDRKSAAFLNEMVIALRGDAQRAEQYPICYPFLEPISPLRFPFDGIDLLYETAKLNIPVPIGPMAQMVVSAPMSLAATAAVENAEILAGVCITQLIRPGMPVCYGGICHAFDMRTTQMIFAGPEQAIFGVAMTQLGKHYGLPVYINVGLTDSKRPDAQAGLEAGVTLALGAAAGADIFGHMGICGVDQAASLDMLVLQHEIIRYVESSLRCLDFSDDGIPLDLIDEVGPGGTFIDTEHTAARYREELFTPEILDRQFFQAWLDGGAVDAEQRCVELRQRLLREHEMDHIPADLDREFTRLVQAAQRNL
jgi:trimethylamine---corrinoid protein Co-methyltransferase